MSDHFTTLRSKGLMIYDEDIYLWNRSLTVYGVLLADVSSWSVWITLLNTKFGDLMGGLFYELLLAADHENQNHFASSCQDFFF